MASGRVNGFEHIQVVDTRTGEMLEEHPLCKVLEDQIAGLQRDVRGWAARYAELKRDKSQAAKQHPLYPDAEIAFKHWQAACNHKRSQFTADRFWLVQPFLDNPKYGLKIVMQAIEGAAFDAYEVRRKNGSTKRFDEWERIFANTGSIEDYANRAPRKKEQQ
jgi:hypothetical protein